MCRRVICPFLAAPSKCSKVFQAISKAHAEWDEKNLKNPPKAAAPVLVSDDDQLPETPTKLPKRKARHKRIKEDGDDTDLTPTKRKKGHVDASDEIGPSAAELNEVNVSVAAAHTSSLYFDYCAGRA